MGGFGSGRQSSHPTVDESYALRLPDLKRAGLLRRWHWTRQIWQWHTSGRETGAVVVIVDLTRDDDWGTLTLKFERAGKSHQQRITLEPVGMRFGGVRWFALCPETGVRCTTLVMPRGLDRFVAARSLRLPYATQRGDAITRTHLAIHKDRTRLVRLSIHARHSTRRKIEQRIAAREAFLVSLIHLANHAYATDGRPRLSQIARTRLVRCL